MRSTVRAVALAALAGLLAVGCGAGSDVADDGGTPVQEPPNDSPGGGTGRAAPSSPSSGRAPDELPPLVLPSGPATTGPAAGALPPPRTDVAVPPPGGPPDVARADLASRLGVPVDDVEVVSVEEVTWPDGSLGCPRPGMSYTQALVDGLRIVLAVDGVTHHYHAGSGGQPFHCPSPSPRPSTGDTRDPST